MAVVLKTPSYKHFPGFRHMFLIPLAMGLFAWIAWIIGEVWLAGFSGQYIPMAPSTALMIIFFSGIAFFHNTISRSNRLTTVTFILTILAFSISLILLISSSHDRYFDIEKLGFSASVFFDSTPAGHMSPITAALFLLLATNSLLAAEKFRMPRIISTSSLRFMLLLAVFLVSFSLLLAYMMGSPIFYGSLRIPPSLPTALSFFVLSFGKILMLVSKGDTSIKRAINEGKSAPLVLFSVFLVLASTIITIGYILHKSYKDHFEAEAQSMLHTVGTFKADQLIQWRQERLADASLMFRNPHLEMLVGNWIGSGKSPEQASEMEKLFAFFLHREYFDSFALCNVDGLTLYTYPAEKTILSKNLIPILQEVSENRDVRFLDLYRNEVDERLYMALVVPVMHRYIPDSLLAFLVLRIDPEVSLFPMVLRWPTRSTTAESLIVRREGDHVMLLNNLRRGPFSAMTITANIHENPERPSVMAITGHEGIVEGKTYNGAPVFASVHHIPDSPWYLIARIDKAEVFASIGSHLFNSIIIILLLIGMTALGLFLLWRQQQNRHLREKLQVIEATDRLKTSFINNISHEIRTPLNSILGFGQLIANHHDTSSGLKNYFQIVLSSSDRLLSTIENYVNMSMLTSGTMAVQIKPLELSDFLRQICHENRTRFSGKGVSLHTELPSGHTTITYQTDRELLKKAVIHLLDNAYKFTTDGTVTAGLRLIDGCPQIFVADTGEGIPQEQMSFAFDPFWRSEQGATSRFEGSGLGLSIVKGIVDKLGGRVDLESAPSSGTIVRMTFFQPVTTGAASLVEEGVATTVSKSVMPLVLVVEDDASSAYYLEVVLNSLDCDVVVAVNGQEAVQLVSDNSNISMVLMDLKMPVMNGYDATRKIKAMRPELPVIAATAYALSGDEKRAWESGCDDYLAKPIKLQALQEVIKKYQIR